MLGLTPAAVAPSTGEETAAGVGALVHAFQVAGASLIWSTTANAAARSVRASSGSICLPYAGRHLVGWTVVAPIYNRLVRVFRDGGLQVRFACQIFDFRLPVSCDTVALFAKVEASVAG